MSELTIGTLAKRTGVNIETIRYYERIGMIPPPPRSAGGQRRYEEAHLRRLAFVRRCRELGFPLDEIRALLALVDGGDYSCAEVRDMTVRQLDAVRLRIADLRVMERTLDTMAAACEGGAVPNCPIVDALFAGRR
jgi:MerR family mercuric resistance operon transcriptional regulator